MRRALLSVCLAGCTFGSGPRPNAPAQPSEDVMPSSVLDNQNPGADTSHNPELTWSRSGAGFGELLGDLLSWHTPAPVFSSPVGTPHYYRGCHCATDSSTDPPVLAIAMVLIVLRRRLAHPPLSSPLRARHALISRSSPGSRQGQPPSGTAAPPRIGQPKQQRLDETQHPALDDDKRE